MKAWAVIRNEQPLECIEMPDPLATGAEVALGVTLTAPFYWDQNDKIRAFSTRYCQRFGRMPNFVQASMSGALLQYLKVCPLVLA